LVARDVKSRQPSEKDRVIVARLVTLGSATAAPDQTRVASRSATDPTVPQSGSNRIEILATS
jgi:hypothetical protein